MARSARHRLLGPESRQLAGRFHRLLARAASDEQACLRLQAAGMQVAYVKSVGQRRCGAVVLGEGADAVRLIDNVPVDPPLQESDIQEASA